MKNIIPLLIALLLAGPQLTSAQTALYIENNTSKAEVTAIDGDNASNTPALYVENGQVENHGVLNVGHSGNRAEIWVNDNFVNDGGDLNLNQDSEYRLDGDWTGQNSSTVTANNNATVRFVGGNATFTQNTPHSNKLGNVQVESDVLAVASNIWVKGDLDFSVGSTDRVVQTSGNYVVIDETGNVTGAYMAAGGNTTNATRYIDGNMRYFLSSKTNYQFPVGEGYTSGSAQPFEISFANDPSGINVDYLEVAYDNGPQPNADGNALACGLDDPTKIQTYSNGVWQYQGRDDGGDDNFTNDADVDESDEDFSITIRPHLWSTTPSGDLAMLHYSTSPSHPENNMWQPISNTNITDPDGFHPCLTGLSNNELSTKQDRKYFSEISAAYNTSSNPFPVEMLPLQATPATDAIRLNWTTLREVNNSHFNIQRSTDGQDFQKIGEKPSKAPGGNASQQLQYTMLDENVEYNQRYYYRLKQFDLDGKSSYSNVAEAILTNTPSGDVQVTLYPNPTEGRVNLQITAQQTSQVRAAFYDATGRLVYEVRESVKPGTQSLNLSDFNNQVAAGTYNAVINVNGEVFSTKLVKTH
jgi:hypothetical protein